MSDNGKTIDGLRGNKETRAWWLVLLPMGLGVSFFVLWAVSSLETAAAAVQSLGLALAAVSIPLVVERVRTGIQDTISRRDTNARLSELAISVLSSVPDQTDENRSLRRWASRLLEQSSGIAIEKSAKDALERSALPSPAGGRPYAEVTTNSGGLRYETIIHSETEYPPSIRVILEFLRSHRADGIESIEKQAFDDGFGAVWRVRGFGMVTSTSGASDIVRNRALFDWLAANKPKSLVRAAKSAVTHSRDWWEVRYEDSHGHVLEAEVPFEFYYDDPRPIFEKPWPTVDEAMK